MTTNSNQLESFIGCVMCSSNFDKIKPVIATSCGHLYHQQCLTKWFISAKELNGLTTCPNCRMNINDAGDVKKIFPDSIIIDQSKEMVFANSEIDKLKTDLKVIKKLLSTERGKTTKLTSKVEKLSNQLASQKMTRHFKESGFNKHKFKKIKDESVSEFRERVKYAYESGEQVEKELRIHFRKISSI